MPSSWIAKPAEDVDLSPFKKLLLSSCGHTFEKEREQALSAALCRRMATLGVDAFDTYHALLTRAEDELLRLTELLTVNETYFFREPEHLNLMVKRLLPEFMAARNQRPVRILSAGCSSGEEPYSIAIMLREQFGTESEQLFTITGVDIDSTVIATARQGVYGVGSFRGMNKSIHERYFEQLEPGKYQVSEIVRKQVGFEVVNLLGTSYPYRMQLPDIILYRNVSIYFPGEIQRQIFGKLAELLVDGGCLLVGASETLHHDIGVLSLVKQDSLFFYRKTPKLVFEERRGASRHSVAPKKARDLTLQSIPFYALKPEAKKGVVPTPALVENDVRERFDNAVDYARKSHHDKALDILNDIIRSDPGFEKAYVLKGSLLLNAARFDEARTVCEAVLSRDPLCLEACLMLGMIARQNGDEEGAFTRFRDAIYLDSGCWLAHFYTAEILFAQGDAKRAKSSYETTQKILAKGVLKAHGQSFFPLVFNAEQFVVICRHKLSLLKENG